LLCMPRDEEYSSQVKILEAVAETHGQTLKVGILEDELMEGLKQDLGIRGTPTFLVLVQGKEKARMLGLADQVSLTDFIKQFSQ